MVCIVTATRPNSALSIDFTSPNISTHVAAQSFFKEKHLSWQVGRIFVPNAWLAVAGLMGGKGGDRHGLSASE